MAYEIDAEDEDEATENTQYMSQHTNVSNEVTNESSQVYMTPAESWQTLKNSEISYNILISVQTFQYNYCLVFRHTMLFMIEVFVDIFF